MKPPYFVEILARNDDVLQRHTVASLPLRLGRGYDNDVILDDSHVGARHAVVEANEDGRLVLRDLGSRNGSVLAGQRRSSIVLDGDTVVRLGHTRLRVRDADFAVAPELADTTMHNWEGAPPALAGLLLIGLFTAAENWLSDTQSVQAIRYLLIIASGLAAGLVWSGFWALANRLFSGHPRLGRHLFILGSGLLALGAWQVASSVAAYAWSAELLTRYGNLVALALACGMLYFHLVTIKPRHARRFAFSCAVLGTTTAALLLLTNLQSTGRAADELYMSVLLPPAVRQSTDHSVAEFMAATATLQHSADAARAQSAKNNDEADEDEEE